MGNSSSTINTRLTPPNDLDLGGVSLRTNFAVWFLVLTIIMIVAAVVSLVILLWLILGRKDDTIEQNKEWFSTIDGLLGLTVIFGVFYYCLYIFPELRITDKLITDLTRVTTFNQSEESFKNNLINLITHKTGETNRNKINTFVKSGIMFDPYNKVSQIQNRAQRENFQELLRQQNYRPISYQAAGLAYPYIGAAPAEVPAVPVPDRRREGAEYPRAEEAQAGEWA